MPGQLAEMGFKIDTMFEGRPFGALQTYNRIAIIDQWVGYDQDGNPVDGDSGLTLANKVFDLQFWMDLVLQGE